VATTSASSCSAATSLRRVLAILFAGAVCACGDTREQNAKTPTVDDAIATMRTYRDRMCACKDSACGERAFREYTAVAEDSRRRLGPTKATPDQGTQMQAVAEQLGSCKLRLDKAR
jgi:hypothetical protein